ncbi:MAG: ATP-dependent helicase, partial [Aeromicrobium sp.]
MARRGQRQAGATRSAPRQQRGTGQRPLEKGDIIRVLARAVREVEAKAQRGPLTPSGRTKFQVVALLVREERTRVKADKTGTEAHRAEQLKRLDGVATILAQTVALDPTVYPLLDENAVFTDAADTLRSEMLQAAG